MKHVVMFSSGIGSWGAGKRVAAKHGKENTILLFMDTKIEDEDNYRTELVQVAAVAVAMVECFDRSRSKGGL